MVSWFTRLTVPAHKLGADSKAGFWHLLAMKMCSIWVRLSNQGTIFVRLGTDTLCVIAMALVWLFSRQVPLAILPFSIYSVFHVATYTRTNLIPTIQPPQQTAPASGASPSAKPTYKSNPMADTIGKFVKQYYDLSMSAVAGLEILLWFRLLLSALMFAKGSWIMIVIYTVFFRARYSQSSFVQGAIAQMTARADAMVANQSTPPAVRQAWETLKGLVRQGADATDVNRYVGGSGPGGKKAQ